MRQVVLVFDANIWRCVRYVISYRIKMSKAEIINNFQRILNGTATFLSMINFLLLHPSLWSISILIASCRLHQLQWALQQSLCQNVLWKLYFKCAKKNVQTVLNEPWHSFFFLSPQADSLFYSDRLRNFPIWDQLSPFQHFLVTLSNGIRHHYLIISFQAADWHFSIEKLP